MDRLILLDRIHGISDVIHGTPGTERMDLEALCGLIASTVSADVYLLDADGVMRAHFLRESSGEVKELGCADGECINPAVNDRLLKVLSTKENVKPQMLGITPADSAESYGCVVPVFAYGKRIGTLFLFNRSSQYDIDETIICEYAADCIGIELANLNLRQETEASGKKTEVRAAFKSLSVSEKEAVAAVFAELKGLEGVLVVNRVSDRTGIGRSVIINSLRKLESAGIIESRSAGMKGTYIKICNEFVHDELKALRSRL